MGKVSIYIVDDHPVVRKGMKQFISQEPDMRVCGDSGEIKTALKEIENIAPDLVVTDLLLDNENGIRLVEEISKRFAIPVLVLSMCDETSFAERCLMAGSRGYVMKKAPPKTVIEAIRTVISGGVYLSPGMSDRIIRKSTSHSNQQGINEPTIVSLSNRELEVFHLLSEGLNTREIAGRLCLSVKTVETHFTHIRKKLDIKNMRDLLKFSIQSNLQGLGSI